MKKNGGHAAQALGRSRGGFSTTSPVGCRAAHPGVAIGLTAGPAQERPVLERVLAEVPPAPAVTQALRDKGSDSNPIRAPLLAQDIVPVIPPKSHRTDPIEDDHDLDTLREKVDRFVNNLKQFRRIATRYAHLSQTFLALMHVVAAWLMIK